MYKSYIPDSVYAVCGEETQDCNVCSNNVFSPVVNGYVHDTQRGKVFCPFGQGDSMNKPIFGDQSFLNASRSPEYSTTTWGRVPQLDPRPLNKIGLTWRTS